jgi:hypothetical protein
MSVRHSSSGNKWRARLQEGGAPGKQPSTEGAAARQESLGGNVQGGARSARQRGRRRGEAAPRRTRRPCPVCDSEAHQQAAAAAEEEEEKARGLCTRTSTCLGRSGSAGAGVVLLGASDARVRPARKPQAGGVESGAADGGVRPEAANRELARVDALL